MNSSVNFAVALAKLERFMALTNECDRQRQALLSTEKKMKDLVSCMTPYEKSVCEAALKRLIKEQRTKP